MKTIKKIWEQVLRFSRFVVKLWRKRQQLNQWMANRYTPRFLALIGTAVCLLVAVITLFTPAYLGMANDSIGNQKMAEYGLSYRESDKGDDPDSFASNEYFTRVYEVSGTGEPINSSQNLFVNAAMLLDSIFTSDSLFDVRYLAAIYLVLYLPAVYLVLKSGLERVHYFSEAMVVTVLGVLIFADVSYLVFFNSLYSDALILICFLYIAGAAMGLHLEKNSQVGLQLILAIAGGVLCLLENRFFLAGIFVAALLLSHMRLAHGATKIMSVVLASLVMVSSVFSLYWAGDEFDDVSKVHSVTRGVLLQSQDPDDTLEEMGIDSSYTLLTDQSLYDYYPISEISNTVLQEGFLDKYDTLDVALYYLKHPGELVLMWNYAIKSALNLRRDYCGNYERSTGMPAMSKSVFFSMWSMFRERSLPATLGYLVLLVVVFSILGGKRLFNHKEVNRWGYVYLATMLTITAIGLGDITEVICLSGDAQLVQCSMTFGVSLDLLFFFVIAEILHELNILEGKDETK